VNERVVEQDCYQCTYYGMFVCSLQITSAILAEADKQFEDGCRFITSTGARPNIRNP
jgi:hypothetical protein